MSTIKIGEQWRKLLADEFDKTYFKSIIEFLKSELSAGKILYPKGSDIFRAFNETPINALKVVIIGQDPYHNPGEAMGLSFSVPKGKKIPPSLRNIFKELYTDLGVEIPSHGDLSHWASQGVLLLNAMLTVEHKKAGSHKKIGWQDFTDAVIKKISHSQSNVVFLLWGRFAQSKANLIDGTKHCILEAAHPSPLARGAFFGNKHFSKTNDYLTKHGKSPIQW